MHKVFQGPKGIVLIGAILGIGAILLTANGNPGNMAICAACFIRDIAGALHLHDAAAVQYLRPEILGIIFGAFLISLQSKEFAAQRLRARGLALRFLLGVVMMIGSLIFLGCPLRMIFRLSAGDLNALMGLAGFLAGIATAVPFLHRGFDLGQSAPVPKPTGGIMPGLILLLIVLGFAAPGIFAQSESGPGSMHAPILLSLGVGLVFGIFCQIGAVCTSGAFRDIFIAKSPARVLPLGIIFFVMLAYNVITGKFHLGFGVADFVQPIAHSNYLWNFLGLYAVGFAATLASGCPLRQMVLAGQGHIEAVVTFLGLLFGAALVHRLGLAASGNSIADGVVKIGVVPPAGKAALIISIVFLFILAVSCRNNAAEPAKRDDTVSEA